MRRVPLSRGLFILGFAVVVTTNIVVLSGVVSNRPKGSERLIELTERELSLPYRIHEENSGLSLRMRWRVIGNVGDDSYNHWSYWRYPAWFNAEKLKELGFNIVDANSSVETSERHKESVPRKVFVVLEYDGGLYKEALRRAEKGFDKAGKALKMEGGEGSNDFERAEKRLKRERVSASRLFAIDAGLDAGVLKEKYDDEARFIIVPGMVKRSYDYNDKKKEAVGYISKISVDNIHVPLEFRKALDSLLVEDESRRDEEYESRPPRYRIELAYGRRFEPWIQSVRVF